MESFDNFSGINDEERKKIADLIGSDEGRHMIARRLEKKLEEVTFDDALALYARDPNPLFFANEIKIDEKEDEAKRLEYIKESRTKKDSGHRRAA